MSKNNQKPEVTVVVVPRESFNMFAEVCQRIYDLTSPIFKMIILEGHAPADRRRELEAIRDKHKDTCEIVYSDKWHHPHDYVNSIIPKIDTKYAVFIDNDVEVIEGWLENLVKCANEEQKHCVHPIYLTVRADDPSQKIHIAEGKWIKKQMGDKMFLDTYATASGVPLKEYPNRVRKHSDFFEWHCVLLSKELLEKVGPLDDLNMAEHMDYSLRIQDAGYDIMLEPASVVCYEYERIWKFRGADREFMLWRWDIDKAIASQNKIGEKWNLHPVSFDRRTYFAKEHTGRVRSTYFVPKTINRLRRLVGLKNLPYCKDPKPGIPEGIEL